MIFSQFFNIYIHDTPSHQRIFTVHRASHVTRGLTVLDDKIDASLTTSLPASVLGSTAA